MQVLRHAKDFVWGAWDYVQVGRHTPRGLCLYLVHPLSGLSCSVHRRLRLDSGGCLPQDIFLSMVVMMQGKRSHCQSNLKVSRTLSEWFESQEQMTCP